MKLSKYRLHASVTALLITASSWAQVKVFGDMDVLGTGTYDSDPTAGATLQGLAAGAFTDATLTQAHSFPFDPSVGEFAGTDQIYVGSQQTGYNDGYSSYSGRIAAPQNLSLDYGSLLPTGQTITGLTLGFAADDFQNPFFGNPFEARINGVVDPALTSVLNALDQTGPKVHFFSIGVDPSLLTNDHVLRLTIDELGNGGDGWAVDFLTIGLTTQPVPEPVAFAPLGLGTLALLRRRKATRAD